MTFLHETDFSVADWWLRGNDWPVRSQHGPPGFAAYVRLRHHDELLDETDVEVLTWPLDDLASHTSTPDDVVVAQWEGTVTDTLVRWADEAQRHVVRSGVVAHVLPREGATVPARRQDGR